MPGQLQPEALAAAAALATSRHSRWPVLCGSRHLAAAAAARLLRPAIRLAVPEAETCRALRQLLQAVAAAALLQLALTEATQLRAAAAAAADALRHRAAMRAAADLAVSAAAAAQDAALQTWDSKGEQVEPIIFGVPEMPVASRIQRASMEQHRQVSTRPAQAAAAAVAIRPVAALVATAVVAQVLAAAAEARTSTAALVALAAMALQ